MNIELKIFSGARMGFLSNCCHSSQLRTDRDCVSCMIQVVVDYAILLNSICCYVSSEFSPNQPLFLSTAQNLEQHW